MGVKIHGRPRKRSARAEAKPPVAAPASGCPPTNRRRARQVARGRDDGTLGTADIRDQRLAANARRQVVEQADILPDRRCEDNQVGAVREREVVPSGVCRARAQRLRDDFSAIDGDDLAPGCDLTKRKRNRSADKPEARNGDFVEHHAMLSAEC